MRRKSEYHPPFKDEGEVIASWGEAQLIRYLNGIPSRGNRRSKRIGCFALKEEGVERYQLGA